MTELRIGSDGYLLCLSNNTNQKSRLELTSNNFRYLDDAIEFGLRECFHAQIETPVLLEVTGIEPLTGRFASVSTATDARI